MEKIKLQSTSTLLKYLNCLERIFFIDNKWMKDYQDIKNNIKREYIGLPLYFKKLLDSLNKFDSGIFGRSLPEKEDILKTDDTYPCIILESIPNSYQESDDDEEKHLTVVACPTLERIFHFKSKQIQDNYMLKKGIIKEFFFHQFFPRIKIQSKNFIVEGSSAKLSELKFLYTLFSDADFKTHRLKIIGNSIDFSELTPDPSLGVQVGSLASYYISFAKVLGLKSYPENIHQIILLTEDWQGNKHELVITVKSFREFFKFNPTEGVFNETKYIRCLVFQEISQLFKSVLALELCSEDEFKKDSLFAYVRFRKFAAANVNQDLQENLPDGIFRKNNLLVYCAGSLPYETFQDYLKMRETNKFPMPDRYILVKQLIEFFKFNPQLINLYKSELDETTLYRQIIIDKANPVGVHKFLLNKPIISLKFYTLNTQMYFFCINCKSFLGRIKLKDLSDECGKCKSKSIVQLVDFQDSALFSHLGAKSITQKMRLDHYDKLSKLFAKFGKFIFLTKAATNNRYIDCVSILNIIYKKDLNIEVFFELIIKLNHNKRDLIYLEENEAL